MSARPPEGEPKAPSPQFPPSGAGSFSDRLDAALRSAKARSSGHETSPPAASAGPAGQQPAGKTAQAVFATPTGSGERVVQSGDCIASIAKESGHFWETIWNDPANSELREARENPNILLPGDRVFVPPLRAKFESRPTQARHRFRRLGEPSVLHVRVLRRDRTPRDGEPYELRVEDARWEGMTDAAGWVSVPIDPKARTGHLTVGPASDQAKYRLALGGTDPIDSITGIQQRLNNLGFAAGPADGVLGPATRAAVMRFQRHHGLPETGTPDDATRAKLLEQHSS